MNFIIKITPDKSKAKSVFKMVNANLEMIRSIDRKRFASGIAREYYEAIREMLSILLLLKGLKTYGDGSHKELIWQAGQMFRDFNESDALFADNLRILRNRIAYDGFFVDESYLERNEKRIKALIEKLSKIILKELG